MNEVQKALELAYIKLVQVGGFDSVDGVKTPDVQAKKQILDAIHTYDATFDYEGVTGDQQLQDGPRWNPFAKGCLTKKESV